MGPNEGWMVNVESELKRSRDQLTNLAINQLASQSQGNYELPSRIQPPDQTEQIDEIYWIRLTEKINYFDQILYSWRRQVKTLGPGGYVWTDTGEGSTFMEYAATGLNNENVSVGTDKRYPAKWNADTSQWVFFSSSSAAGAEMFRWEGNVYLSCNFPENPVILSCHTLNPTLDEAGLAHAMSYLSSCHNQIVYFQRNIAYNSGEIFDWIYTKLWGVVSTTPDASSQSWINSSHLLLLTAYNLTGSHCKVGYFGNGLAPKELYEDEFLADIIPTHFCPGIGVINVEQQFPGQVAYRDYYDTNEPLVPAVSYTMEPGPNGETYSGLPVKYVSFKKYLANGTYPGNWGNMSTTTPYFLLKVQGLPISGSLDGYYHSADFGPTRDTVGYYTFNASVLLYKYADWGTGGTLISTTNGTITISWGNSICNGGMSNNNWNIINSNQTET
jgi:hypothetical protein